MIAEFSGSRNFTSKRNHNLDTSVLYLLSIHLLLAPVLVCASVNDATSIHLKMNINNLPSKRMVVSTSSAFIQDKRRRLDDNNEAIKPKFATNVVQNNSSSSSSSSNSNAVHAPFDGKEVEEQHRDHDQEIEVLLKLIFPSKKSPKDEYYFKNDIPFDRLLEAHAYCKRKMEPSSSPRGQTVAFEYYLRKKKIETIISERDPYHFFF